VTGSGTVKYRFARRNVRDGVGPERKIEFFNSGTKEVSTTWQFGGSKYPNPSGSFYLEIIAPELKQSEDADYNIKCQQTSGTILIPTPTPTPAP
jgi:hypothetical protein